tara:strand:- start:2674 stop:3609 length:936 start_codon:yes stop_codon:yes gene_type:complete
MGHIIMWKGKRVSHEEYSNEMGSHVAPDVDLSKNFKYVLNRAMSEWKSNSYGITRFRPVITPMWRSWDREDGRRDKYEIGYNYQNGEGDTEYVFTCCVRLIKYDELHPGYPKDPEIKFFSSKKDTKPIEDPKDSSNPHIPSVNYIVKKYWDKYEDTIDSTQVNDSLQRYVERNFFVKQLDSRVYWMHSKDSEDWTLLAKNLDDMGIVIRDFPPSSSPESMKSLFDVVREDFIKIQAELDDLNTRENQTDRVMRIRKDIGEKWRAEVALLKPLLSEMDEFNKLVESVEESARRAEYEANVNVNADVFSDIEL